MDTENLLSREVGFQYMICFYLAQVFTTGYGGPYPMTQVELLFTLLVMFCGIVMYIILIGAMGVLILSLDARYLLSLCGGGEAGNRAARVHSFIVLLF